MRFSTTSVLILGLVSAGVAGAHEPKEDPGSVEEAVATPAGKTPGRVAAGGLGLGTGTAAPASDRVVTEHATDCEHEPLFGGVLVPLGDVAAHAEVTFDPETSIFTVYILDADALEPVRIKQPHFMFRITTDFLDQDRVVLLAAKEDDETGEQAGDTSVFWGGNRKLTGATTFAGRIDQIAIESVTYHGVDFSYPR